MRWFWNIMNFLFIYSINWLILVWSGLFLISYFVLAYLVWDYKLEMLLKTLGSKWVEKDRSFSVFAGFSSLILEFSFSRTFFDYFSRLLNESLSASLHKLKGVEHSSKFEGFSICSFASFEEMINRFLWAKIILLGLIFFFIIIEL